MTESGDIIDSVTGTTTTTANMSNTTIDAPTPASTTKNYKHKNRIPILEHPCRQVIQ